MVIYGFESKVFVDPENWPGLWITRNYPGWSYLAYYRLVFKTIGYKTAS